MTPQVAKSVSVIYGLNEDSTLVMVHVVVEGVGVAAQWAMTDTQAQAHGREIEKYRALLRPEAKGRAN
jgi:hypothetical protein